MLNKYFTQHVLVRYEFTLMVSNSWEFPLMTSTAQHS